MTLDYRSLNTEEIEKELKKDNQCIIRLTKRKANICKKMIDYYDQMAGKKTGTESTIKVAIKALFLQLWATIFFRKLSSIVVSYSAFKASYRIYDCDENFRCIELKK